MDPLECLATMAIQGGCFAAGDILAQRVEMHLSTQAVTRYHEIVKQREEEALAKHEPAPEPREEDIPVVPVFNWDRHIRMTTIAILWGGSTSYLRFKFLAVYLPPSTFGVAVEKAFINQVIFSPIHEAGLFFLYSITKNGDPNEAWLKIKNDSFWVQNVVIATKVPINIVVFYFVKSIPLQVFCMRAFDILYFSFISHVTAHQRIEQMAEGGHGKTLTPRFDNPDASSSDSEDETQKKAKIRPCKCMRGCVVS